MLKNEHSVVAISNRGTRKHKTQYLDQKLPVIIQDNVGQTIFNGFGL